MNNKMKDLMIKLGYVYNYSKEDDNHIFEKKNSIVTFDDRYGFIAIDNNIGEYTIDYSDCGFEWWWMNKYQEALNRIKVHVHEY